MIFHRSQSDITLKMQKRPPPTEHGRKKNKNKKEERSPVPCFSLSEIKLHHYAWSRIFLKHNM